MQPARRTTVFAVATANALLGLALLLAGCGGGGGKGAPDVVSLAKTRFAEARAKGVPMSRGPCLGVIAPGWVVDVAHDPRQPVDDLPQNQCRQFKHFVEPDPSGNVIRKL